MPSGTDSKVAFMTETQRDTESGQVVRLEAAEAALRDHFLGWQCRLRQLAVREAGGRPTSGMRPELRLDVEGPPIGTITWTPDVGTKKSSSISVSKDAASDNPIKPVS